jgi:hypothetical protein
MIDPNTINSANAPSLIRAAAGTLLDRLGAPSEFSGNRGAHHIPLGTTELTQVPEGVEPVVSIDEFPADPAVALRISYLVQQETGARFIQIPTNPQTMLTIKAYNPGHGGGSAHDGYHRTPAFDREMTPDELVTLARDLTRIAG